MTDARQMFFMRAAVAGQVDESLDPIDVMYLRGLARNAAPASAAAPTPQAAPLSAAPTASRLNAPAPLKYEGPWPIPANSTIESSVLDKLLSGACFDLALILPPPNAYLLSADGKAQPKKREISNLLLWRAAWDRARAAMELHMQAVQTDVFKPPSHHWKTPAADTLTRMDSYARMIADIQVNTDEQTALAYDQAHRAVRQLWFTPDWEAQDPALYLNCRG